MTSLAINNSGRRVRGPEHSDHWWMLYDQPAKTVLYGLIRSTGEKYCWFDLYVVNGGRLVKLRLEPREIAAARRTPTRGNFMCPTMAGHPLEMTVGAIGIMVHRDPLWFVPEVL